MNVLRIVIIVGLAAALYRTLPEYPSKYSYSLLAKTQVAIFHVLVSIGFWTHKIGAPRWGPIRFAFYVIPQGSTPENISVDKRNLNGVDCLRVYPNDFFQRQERQAAVVYFHGGGWVSGTPEFYLPMAYELIQKLDVLVVLPDYRIAPQHPFPVPFQDCLNATEYLLQLNNDLNVDSNRVIISGDSAGGNLAASVSLSTSKQVKMTVLIYPLLQFVDFTLPSYEQNGGRPMVSLENTAQAWLSYIGLYKHMYYLEEALIGGVHTHTTNKTAREIISRIDQTYIPESFKQRQRVKRKAPRKRIRDYMKPLEKYILEKATDYRIAPLMASDAILNRMPTTYVLTCEYDVLRDDGVLFVERLRRIKKEVYLQNLQFGYHGIASVNLLTPDQDTTDEFNKMFHKMKTVLNAT